MFRNLILLIVIGLVVWLISQSLKNKSRSKSGSTTKIKNIVQCQQCHVYIPEDQAIKQNSHYFCTHEHLQEWKENS